jgi:UDP-N-acetyl-D-galactosamine dehydrogenase
MMILSEVRLAVIGLGYVGLPLAVEFGKSIPVIGFDINEQRIQSLRGSKDHTLELTSDQILESKYLSFSDSVEELRSKNVFIVTVPTPIDENNSPDFTPLRSASKMLGGLLKRGDIVIYESTVYPGATEEVCVPILESVSGLVFNQDFFAGYSPERINPGDKENTLTKIKKITSGSTPDVAKLVDQLYRSIITAGTHLAGSIKVAEAAKVIENTQRDLNIAIINEFAKIFNILAIDTQEVLDAAGTKWNFLPFKPGLVGGHCISVDPYYLTYKAKEVGYQPEVILAGRHINDGMGEYVAIQLVKKISSKKIHIDQARVLILGFTFKGDCPDVRNTKVVDMYNELKSFNMSVDVYDNWANPVEVQHEYGIKLIDKLIDGSYDAIVIAVDHTDFQSWGESTIRKLGKSNHVLYDLKYSLPKSASDLRL